MLERLNFVIGCKYCQFFLQVSALLYSFPRNSLPNTQIWMTIVCQLFFQLKVISREKKWQGQLPTQLSLPPGFSNGRSALCIHFITSYNMERMLTQESVFNKISNFYCCFLKDIGKSNWSGYFVFSVCVYCEYVVVANTMMTSMIWCNHLNSS